MNRAILDDRRVVLGGTALVAVLMLAVAWFAGVGPQLSAADTSATQQADAETQYATMQAKIADLADKKSRISTLEDELVAAQDGLPATTALPAFTRQVTAAAERTGVDLGDVTISAPTGAAVTGAAPTEEDAAAAAGPQAIAVSLTSKGSLQEQAAFVKSLQRGDRRALVSAVQMTVGGTSGVASLDRGNTMTTQITIFTAP